MNETLSSIVEKNFDNQIKDTIELINIKSVAEKSSDDNHPFGKGASDCLNLFLKKAESMGFKTKNIDNIVGWAEIGTGEKLYGILAHLDTVAEGNIEKWICNPFSGEIIDGALYGRGAEDDKGPAICGLYALKALKESNIKLNARYRIIVGLDEESGMKCAQRYAQSEEMPIFSFSPDAKFPLINGEKGIIQFSLKRSFTQTAPAPIRLLGLKGGTRFNVVPDVAYAYFTENTARAEIAIEEINDPRISLSYNGNFLEVKANGIACHAMHPEKGQNAIQALLEVISQVDFIPNELMRLTKTISSYLKNETNGKTLGIACSDDISGELTLNTAMINSDSKDLILRMEIRYPVTKKPEEMEEAVINIAKKFGMLLQINSHKAPLYIPADTIEIKTLLSAFKDITGIDGKPFTIGGGTYCKAFPNSVTFGAVMPNSQEFAHEENERILIEDLKYATKIYALSLFKLNNL